MRETRDFALGGLFLDAPDGDRPDPGAPKVNQ